MASKRSVGLSAERWAYLKALRPSPGRWFHMSVGIRQVPHPTLEGVISLVAAYPGTTYVTPATAIRRMRDQVQQGVAL